ncbi:hypothetical protein FRC00_002439 [Tulasnella sp. 408]|nr:hypothetical protein FRC00_002439 [Tulasnella sp. 408]
MIDHINHLRYQLDNRLCGPSLLPNLRSLDLKMPGDKPHLYEVLPIIPAELQVLSVATAVGTTQPDIQSLLELLTAIPLSQLSIIYFYDCTPIELDASKLATFLQPNQSTLVELHLSPFPLAVSDLEQVGSLPRVTELALLQKGTAMELNRFFNVIASSFPKLRAIEVTLDDTIEEEVSVAVFEDLAACGELKVVFLKSHRWKKLTRGDVARFGSWWPLMGMFCLHQPDHYLDQIKTPLGILQEFARAWSRTLYKILLQFDTEVALPSSSSVRFKFEELGTLWVGRSRVRKRRFESVADFLRTIAPRELEIIALGGDREEYDYESRWEIVMNKVNARFSVRSDAVPT